MHLGFFRVACRRLFKLSLGFHVWFHLGFHLGFHLRIFKISFVFHVAVLTRISYQDFFRVYLGFTQGLSRVSFRIHKQERIKKQFEKQKAKRH